MPVYVYETTDDAEPIRFEMRQSMHDPALDRDPETGRSVRRVISGGFGLMRKAGDAAPMPAPAGHGCGAGGCGCH